MKAGGGIYERRQAEGERQKRHSRKRLGKSGEFLAGEFLESLGYRILHHNFRTRYGELDCVAQDGDTLVFVEVKTRRTEAYGTPEEAVTARKRAHLCRAALAYLQERPLLDSPCRFDVVAIMIGEKPPRIVHIKDAFTCEGVV